MNAGSFSQGSDKRVANIFILNKTAGDLWVAPANPVILLTIFVCEDGYTAQTCRIFVYQEERSG
jgi:hypothetical protein